MDRDDEKIMCPAHRAKQGSLLLGARLDDGTVAIFPEALPVTDEFIEQAQHHPNSPEERFRFANKCIGGSCKQWTGNGCGVVEHVVQFLDSVEPIDPHYPCSIRSNCRWFRQKGYDACRICPYVLREISEAEISDYFEKKGFGE